MTDQELIAEAKQRGYVIFKRKEWVSLMKCPVCGKKPLMWGQTGRMFYECPNGHIISDCGNRRQARLNWNAMVEGYHG